MRSRVWIIAVVLALLVVAAAGCGGGDDDSGGAATTAATTAETTEGGADGAAVFASSCGSCHTLEAAGTSGSTGPNLDDLMLPVSLRIFNATRNSFTSASTSFANLPTALQYLCVPRDRC